jgi:hypothetical protein
MQQKFKAYSFVHVSKKMPKTMSHFEKDFDGIIQGTYEQIYHNGCDFKSYSVYQIENGKVVNCISWYPESVIEKLKNHKYKDAQGMVEDFLIGIQKESDNENNFK